MAVKTKCNVTREEFRQKAGPIDGKVGNTAIVLEAKEFSTGSLGWFANGKVTVEVGGKRVMCQLGLNLTILGSKDAE